jgi:Tol biopolymer transport system component
MALTGAAVQQGNSVRARLANGAGQEEVLLDRDPSDPRATFIVPQWSPDGRYLLYLKQSGPAGAAIWALPTFGDKKPFLVVQPQSPQSKVVQFVLSPDGHWLAYSSDESGHEEIYVTHFPSFPSGPGRWQISQSGATYPVWRGDSKEIWFVASDGFFHAVTVNSNPNSEEFVSDPPRTLFQYTSTASVGSPYDLAPDGQHLVVTMLPGGAATPLVLVSNWTADLPK